MARVAITPEELRNVGAEFKSSATEIGETMNKLEQQVIGLESSWEGAAQMAYFAQYQEKKQVVKQFEELVNNFGEQLNQIADELESTDEALANALK